MDPQQESAIDRIQAERTLSPEVLRTVAEEVKRSFVRAPGKTQLVLIEVDPYRLHAFWTVTPDAMELARNALGNDGSNASMILRVMETDTNDNGSPEGATFDVNVGGLQSRSYVDVFGEARRYRAVLGLRAGDNRFVALATSNTVELPPASSNGSDEVLLINIDAPEAGTFPLQPASLDAGAPAPFPLPPDMLDNQDDEWTDGREALTSEPLSAEAGVSAETPPGRPPLILEQALASSSYGLGRAGEFEFTAELHVFGHTEPDRELHLFGQKVPLRPDGSFSIIRLLPNDPGVIEALLASGDSPMDRRDG